MWRGLAVLCEDLLTWWRCGRLWKRRFGLGISARRKSGGADFHGESSLVAGHGRDGVCARMVACDFHHE